MTTRRAIPRSALLLSLVACGGGGTDEEAVREATVVARTAVVTEMPFRETISAIGQVVPRVGSVALLSAPAATRVAAVMAVAGQAVAKGAVLVEFEQGPFQARAQAAEAALQAAERARDRARRLVDEGIAPRKDLDQAEAELARAQAEAVAVRRDAQLSRLRAPISGVVTKMDAVLGASVDASQPLVEIANPRSIDVLLNVAPEDAARIRVGTRVMLTTGQGAGAEPLGTMTVSDVGAAVDPETRAVAVRVRGGAPRRALRIGESVSAELTVAEYPRALTVPLAALVPDGERYSVFVVDAGNVAHARLVKLGGRTAAVARVVEGLTAGERVVAEGAFGVSEGSRIIPPDSASTRSEAVPPPAAGPR